jgi:hypothetical protein
MLAVIACLKMWGTKFKEKRILIKCDNQVTVYVTRLVIGTSRTVGSAKKFVLEM